MQGDRKDTATSSLDVQQQRWLAGDCATVETLMRELSLNMNSDAVLDLIYSEILLREDAAEHPTEQEYVDRFPDLKDAIVRQFQVHRALDVQLPDDPIKQLQGTDDGRMAITISDTTSKPPIRSRQIPGFELLNVVGQGASGIAYRAIDQGLNRTVAVKLLLKPDGPDDSHHKQLLREAEASALLKHPGIVQVYQVGESNGAPFMVMEFMEGGSLAERLQTGPIQATKAAELVQRIADAVHHAHDQGVIHRDIKPGNVLLGTDGKPRVCDFGLARRLDTEHSVHSTGAVIGTPAYMSPEQARGERGDERSDVYSIGAVLYESLCGRSPFQAATAWEILSQVISNDVTPLRQLNSSLPQDLETVCDRCLEKDPARRYSSAAEVSDDLKRFLNNEPILASPISRWQRFVKWCGRNRRIAALAATSIGLVLAIGIGSTIAAVSLSSANATIRQEQLITQQAEERANNDRQAAVDSLNQLVESLYDDLSNNAATLKTREKVVDAAINGLTAITQANGGRDANDREGNETSIIAYQRIGDLQRMKGEYAKAETNFKIAVELAEKNAKQVPETPRSQRILAQSFGHLSVLHTVLGNNEDAARSSKKSVLILEKVLKDNPDDRLALRQLVTQKSQEYDYRWRTSGDRKAQVEFGIAAAAIADRLLQMKDADAEANFAAQAIQFRLGRTYLESGDSTQAATHFAKARSHIDTALDAFPENAQWKSASAVLDRASAMVVGARGDFDESLRLFEQALVAFKQILATDPANVFQQQQVANTNSLMSTAFHAAGKEEKAIALLKEAIATYRTMSDKMPQDDTIRVLIAESYLKQADCHQYLNQWQEASQCYQDIKGYLKSAGGEQPIAGPAAEYYANYSTMLEEGVLRIQGLPTDQQTTTGEYLALAFLAREGAQTAVMAELSPHTIDAVAKVNADLKVTTFEGLLQRLRDIPDLSPVFADGMELVEARINGFLARNLAKTDSPDGTELSNRYLKQVIESLQKAVKKSPVAVNTIIAEPDLEWIRATKEFQNAGIIDRGE